MSTTLRAALSFLGFIAVVGILMSDQFQDISDAVPESLYYYTFMVVLVGATGVGLYVWWQHYNGNKMHPAVDRLRKFWENPPWWLWPF